MAKVTKKTTKKKTTKKTKALVAGISSNHPFAPFAENILILFVEPALKQILESQPSTFGEVLKAYNKATHSKITPKVLRSWMKSLGWSFDRRWTLQSNSIAPTLKAPKTPKTIEQAVEKVLETETEEFDGFDAPISGVIATERENPAEREAKKERALKAQVLDEPRYATVIEA